MKNKFMVCGLMGFLLLTAFEHALGSAAVCIVMDPQAGPRIQYGAKQLQAALVSVHYPVIVQPKPVPGMRCIRLDCQAHQTIPSEGFVFEMSPDQNITIEGGDDSGILYGCMELAERFQKNHEWPGRELDGWHDAPVMKLRGTCVGLQKTYILPGRHVYEYPITPGLFPWFYDRSLWVQYLDFLAQNRMNTLYLWSGHPFASLVRVKDYPYAVEVPEATFRENRELYRWLVQECDRRGIWLVQMFYNILVSKPFAETNGISTQLSAPTPLTEDYTRKSIAQFVNDYPHVGLLVCLGEALRGTENQLEWCTNVIIPGMMDGMREAGLQCEPPIVIRTHAMDPYAIMPAACSLYTNLFTMSKYNGESLTTWEPRGKDQAIHLAMSKLGPHVVNVHILSNLEPFRYEDVDFIKKCVQACRERLGATGLHLYPLCYWNWPYSADAVEPPLLQWQRDWIWFTAWARYSWNPYIPDAADHEYWIGRLTDYYGDETAARHLLEAMNQAGEIAPILIRRLGITEGNRQTLSLGMTLDELVHPKKYGAIPDLWESQAPPGERLDEYVQKEWNHLPHAGETPESAIQQALACAARAVEEVDAAGPFVKKNRGEYLRLRNDIDCQHALAENYAAKTKAAEWMLRFDYSHKNEDRVQAGQCLAQSLKWFEELDRLATPAYHFANGMQTSQRKIPFTGGHGRTGANYLWSQVLPLYQKELADFQAGLDAAAPARADHSPSATPWPAAGFTLLSTNAESYPVALGARVFTDRDFVLEKINPALRGMTGIRFSHEQAKKGHYQPIVFSVREPVRVLVGYFDSSAKGWLQVPQLETTAQADERGGVDVALPDAVTVSGCPLVNVHAFRFDAGVQKLEMIGQGSFIILGVVPASFDLAAPAGGI